MMDRFDALSLREKIMVLIMMVLVVIFIIWQFILAPLGQYYHQAQRDQVKSQKDRVFVEQNISALGASAPVSGREAFSRTALVSASRAVGIERLSRIQPQPNGDLKVWMDNVSGPQLFKFLENVEQTYATSVTGAQVTRQDGAVVSAQISFSMPAEG